MTATRADIERWLEEGIKVKATHMIVITDTFSYSNYPHYIGPESCVRAAIVQLGNMQRPEEVYNLTKPLEPQLNMPRCWEI
jgi:hypothetical protein